MLLGNIKEIRKRKNEVLEKLINNFSVDIIAGDFNSDLICYMNDELLPQQLCYFKTVSPKTSVEVFKEWNISPYKYLKSKNFNLAIDKSDVKYTSIYNSHPDSIWFKNNSLIDYKYIDLITNDLSGHNVIFCNFII